MTAQPKINWDQIKGAWLQTKGEARKQWGKLTDNDLEEIKGDRDILAGKIQQHYGVAKADAHAQIDKWATDVKV